MPRTKANVAVELFRFVRDSIQYKVTWHLPTKKDLRASITLERGYGFCIPKAILLATLARAVNIPSRLHFADILNHKVSDRLRKHMGTNLFSYHGYPEFLLDGRWIKANPAFDEPLCKEKEYPVVTFNGRQDAIFPKVDVHGDPFIEYVADHGTFADVPYDRIVQAWIYHYAGTV